MTKEWWKEDDIKTTPNRKEQIIDGVLVTTFGSDYMSRQYNPPSSEEKRLQSMTRLEYHHHRVEKAKENIQRYLKLIGK
jgi:hypothetical protein